MSDYETRFRALTLAASPEEAPNHVVDRAAKYLAFLSSPAADAGSVNWADEPHATADEDGVAVLSEALQQAISYLAQVDPFAPGRPETLATHAYREELRAKGIRPFGQVAAPKSTKNLAEIIKANPDAVAVIEDYHWTLYKAGSDPMSTAVGIGSGDWGERNTLASNRDTFDPPLSKRQHREGRGLLEFIATLAGITVEVV